MKQVHQEKIHTGSVEGRIYPGLAKKFYLERIHLSENKTWREEVVPVQVGCAIGKPELGKLIEELQYVYNKMS